MRSSAAVFFFACAGLLLLAACGTDTPSGTTDEVEFAPGQRAANFAASPVEFMRSVGCRPTTGKRDTHTIALRDGGGSMLRFNCADVPEDSISAAIRRYKTELLGSSGASVESWGGGEGGLVYLYTSYHCEFTDVWTYVPAMGEYVYTYREGWCEFHEHWWDPSSGSSGGSGQPNAGSTPDPVEDQCTGDDPKCWRLAKKSERDRIKHAYDHQFADSSAITDSTAKLECRAVRQWLDVAMATLNDTVGGKIWVGNTSAERMDQRHDGWNDDNHLRFHVDKDLLTRADTSTAWEKELLAVLLHEAAHLYPQRREHQNATSWSALHLGEVRPPEQLYENDPFFRTIHSNTAGSRCVKS